MKERRTRGALLTAGWCVLIAASQAGCELQPRPVPIQVTGGVAEHGPELMRRYGCDGCHTVPGVRGARGLVGPPLAGIGERMYIAGVLRNTPDNLVRWIMAPQVVQPGNAMPDMGVQEEHARHIAAYLYTLP